MDHRGGGSSTCGCSSWAWAALPVPVPCAITTCSSSREQKVVGDVLALEECRLPIRQPIGGGDPLNPRMRQNVFLRACLSAAPLSPTPPRCVQIFGASFLHPVIKIYFLLLIGRNRPLFDSTLNLRPWTPLLLWGFIFLHRLKLLHYPISRKEACILYKVYSFLCGALQFRQYLVI
ncbi:unnamed protein product [Trypanosoma congolense IL3000]|uniref:WGS project CAEQ00000000 data, annotated contig 1505 n=1 Tax=Trypanosoma congolense (strain IL3000) TaxID=1068625 RepID=F9W6Q5_TRYCI|nr:unnamed protein product [Trypanosoma congolense IL3000]